MALCSNRAYTVNAANRLTGVTANAGAQSATSTAVTSDADGNTLTDSAGRTFTWDSENRMTSCALPGGGTTTFTYGADGLRRSMTTTTGGVTSTIDYAYDGSMLVREFQHSGTSNQLLPTATYSQGLRGPLYRRSESTGMKLDFQQVRP